MNNIPVQATYFEQPYNKMPMPQGSVRRGDGDGMDSEALANPTKLPEPSLGRHQNLRMTPHVTTIVKLASPRPVPHEPVKAAVRRVSSNFNRDKQNTKFHSSPSEHSVKKNKQTGATVKAIKTSPASPTLKSTGSLTPLTVDTFSLSPVSSKKSHTESTSPLPKAGQSCVPHVDTPGLSNQRSLAAISHFNLEGRSVVEGRVEKCQNQLLDDLQQLQQQLDFQIKVNSDLKKLLVASMGDDMQCKVESLAKDKVALGQQLGQYCDTLTKHSENLDSVSIQADLWRTKFIASRVQVDGLQTAYNGMAEKWRSSYQALHALYNETQQLYSAFINTQRCLSDLVGALDPASTHMKSKGNTIIDVASNTEWMADLLRTRLVGNRFHVSDQALEQIPISTPAQANAKQILYSLPTEPGACVMSRSASMKFIRWHPAVLCDNITFNCCPRCKGELAVI